MVSDVVVIALIAAVPPTLLGLATLLSSIHTVRNLSGIRLLINGRLDQLLESERGTAHLQGISAERERHHTMEDPHA